MLNNTIKDFFSKYYSRNLTEKESLSIDRAIESHGIDTNGKWLIGLFEDLQGASLNKKVELTAPNYPDGDNGFSNLLADLNDDFGFDLGDFEDYGEGIEWSLESIGVKFILSREGSPDYYEVKPIGCK